MKIQRLRVEQFRQFRQPLEITDFSTGLNLFSGPNESGKSTLVRAIRAAFFEKCRSSSVADLQPWGDSSAAPEVQLDFEHEGQVWHLAKRFLQRKRCDINVGGQQLSGDDAEERLASLLGFQLPSKGASKADHWGIPGLLWIQQGQGQEVRDPVQFASDHLKTALGATLGEITSSGGDEVIAIVQAQRAALLTKTGKPTGEYAAAIQKRDELREALEEFNTKITGYQTQVDRLGELRARHSKDEAERPWEKLREQQQQAEQLLDEVEKLAAEQATDIKALDDCRQNIELVTNQLEGFQHQANQLKQRQQAHQQAQQQLEQLRAQQTDLQKTLAQAKDRYEAAREQERQCRQYTRRQGLEREQEQLSAQQQKLLNSLEQARKLQHELLEHQQAQSSCRIDAKELSQLKTLNDELRELQIQQQSIATRLKFELELGQSLQLNGKLLTETGEQLLLEEAQLDIPGVGHLRIIPGGEDLGGVARLLEQKQERFAILLQHLQVDSLHQAEQRAEQFKALQAAIKSHQQLLQSHAPQGLDALEAEQKLLQQQIADLQQRLAALPELPEQIMDGQQAEQELESASQRLKKAENEEQQHLRRLASAEQRATNAVEEMQKLEAALADPQQKQREQECSRRLMDLRAQETNLNARIEQRNQRIEAERPDILKQDVTRYRDSARQAETTFNARKEELARLETELTTLGAQGLEEQRAECVTELESVSRRHDELKRRADATSLLLDLLQQKRQVLTRRLQAPLQKHLNHYLQLLFPEASLEVDENLMPGQLSRQNSHGPETGDFEALSFGSREQMGLISRLAYADLLKQAGKPTLIILDDALVHTDQDRLVQMKRILFDASQRHQILLFTCHPYKWQDMGVPLRELAELRGVDADVYA